MERTYSFNSNIELVSAGSSFVVSGSTIEGIRGCDAGGPKSGTLRIPGTFTEITIQGSGSSECGHNRDAFNLQVGVLAVPQIACSGFLPPFDHPLALKEKVNRAIPLKIGLTDADGFVVTDQSILAPPVVNVLFNGTVFGTVPPNDANLLPPGAANEENMFRFDAGSNQWIYNLGTKQFGATGSYTVSVAPGDNSEYAFSTPNGVCTQTFERFP